MSGLRKLDPRHWRLIRRTIDRLREKFFTVTGSMRQFKLDPDVTMDEVQAAFGRQYFMPSWDLAYYYEGEDLNMVRFYRDAAYSEDHPWRQTHVRGFEVNGGIELAVHDELSARMHPHHHLKGHEYSYDRAIERVKEALDAEDIEYTQKQYDNPHR